MSNLLLATSTLAFLGWLMLIIAIFTTSINLRSRLLFLAGRGIPILLCVVYAVLLIPVFKTRPAEGSIFSVAGVIALLSQPWAALAGWIHFEAFDLLVGRWIFDDATDKKTHKLPLLACLLLTLRFGPAGLLAYLGVRYLKKG
jgi:hypothetical protein